MVSREVKRGQVTIFIIVAIIIVGLVVLAFLFFPQIKTSLGLQQQNPIAFIQTCLQPEIKDVVEKVSLRGGSLEPEFYVLYNNEKLEYLCYSSENYRLCTIQQPMLIFHIEEEIKNDIRDDVNDCFTSLQENFHGRGYQVDIKIGNVDVELLPERVVTTMNYSVTLTKTNTESYKSFNVVLNNNLYELASIANSIVRLENEVGNIEPTIYMSIYSYLKVERIYKLDGTKIYILTDKVMGNKFQFASRSLVFPQGI